MSTLRDSSRGTFGSTDSIEHINAGSMQRIADAAEKMASGVDTLHAALAYSEAIAKHWRECAEKLARRNAALRGHLTRLRKKP